MRIRHHLLPSLFLPAVLLFGGAAEVEAQQGASLWSDSATWPGGQVPGEGDAVTIAEGMDVVLDVSPPALRSLTINGKLSFSDDRDLDLTTEWIVLTGELEIGTESSPHTRNVTITFTDNVTGEDIMAGMGDRGLMISGGTLNLHGDRTHTWTKLAETAEAGSDTIEVLDAAEWRVGDQIVLASTDFNARQAERRTIAAISGNTITLDQPLQYMHFGEITFDVDQRGEVANLTRNIRIQASADAEESFFGGHIMAMPGSRMYVEGVELTRMGQNLTLARYPIHWHLVGDAQGQYIRNAAIHNTYNRCVTVHGTNYLKVENNVTYNNVGHCFFLEDGIEHSNEFIGNLGIQTKCHTSKPCVATNLAANGSDYASDMSGQTNGDALIPSDNTVSTFWITNPDNTYRDNVAAGSDQIGFWLAFPEHPTGQFEGTEISANTWPRRTQIREFSGNTAHSNVDGLILDRGPDAEGRFNVGGAPHAAFADPAVGNADGASPIESFIEDFTAYKSRNGGVWGRGEMHVFTGLKLADNAIGYTHAIAGFSPQGGDYTSKVVDSLFVGETDNVGNPSTPEEIAYGRSLPYPSLPDYPIRGYEFYDFLHHVEDTKFVNYEDNDQRRAGALSYLMFTSFGVSLDNSIENVEFVDAKPAHFPEMNLDWGSDGGGGGWRVAGFTDIDGSLGFGPNAKVVNDIGLLSTMEGCEAQAGWGAVVCRGVDIGRINVGGGGGFGGFGGGRGNAAPPPPPVVISRDGVEFTATGQTSVVAGTEIRVETEREELPISLSQLDTGAWVIFELPGFTGAASGMQLGSLDALRDAGDTAYYADGDTLWVKLVVADNPAGGGARGGRGGFGGFGGGTSIQVTR